LSNPICSAFLVITRAPAYLRANSRRARAGIPGWTASMSLSNSALVITVLQLARSPFSAEEVSHRPLIVMIGLSNAVSEVMAESGLRVLAKAVLEAGADCQDEGLIFSFACPQESVPSNRQITLCRIILRLCLSLLRSVTKSDDRVVPSKLS